MTPYCCSKLLYFPATVEILCSVLSAPANGAVSFSGEELGVGIIANFSCDPGFLLVGHITRTCEFVSKTFTSGYWSGSTPQCDSKQEHS